MSSRGMFLDATNNTERSMGAPSSGAHQPLATTLQCSSALSVHSATPMYLGVDSATHAAEQSDGGAAQTVASDGLEETAPVVTVELERGVGIDNVVSGGEMWSEAFPRLR